MLGGLNMLKGIVPLESDTASVVNAIRRASFVYLKRGLGNDYKLISTDDAMKVIESSGYGAGVKVDDAGMLYVSVPCMADLW